jgi:hypothetical protein
MNRFALMRHNRSFNPTLQRATVQSIQGMDLSGTKALLEKMDADETCRERLRAAHEYSMKKNGYGLSIWVLYTSRCRHNASAAAHETEMAAVTTKIENERVRMKSEINRESLCAE